MEDLDTDGLILVLMHVKNVHLPVNCHSSKNSAGNGEMEYKERY